MQSSSAVENFAEAPTFEAPNEWNTFEARRRRTLLFLLFAAVYVGFHLVTRWVEYPLFHADWYYFGGEPPPWYEPAYLHRWFLTFLPLAAWAGVVFFLLTRLSFLTHRRVAFVVVLLGLVFFEGNMRWFQMSNNHVSWNDLCLFFDGHARADLGLHSALYEEVGWLLANHLFGLTVCVFLAGPEARSCIQAIWNGPVGRTYFGIVCQWFYRAVTKLRLEAALFCVLGWLDSKAAFACIAGLVMVDPVVIWALDTEQQDNQAERTVVRQLADSNPLRLQSLDRAWHRVVFAYSDESQDLAEANAALGSLDPHTTGARGLALAIPKRKTPAQPDNVLILQAESLSAEIFDQTDLPFLNEFSKKCLRLKQHFSTGNATHFGILGLLHGNPVTFFRGAREKHRPNPYLDHFKERGYKTRLITRAVMDHHHLGHYVPNWTEPVSEPSDDFRSIPEILEELAKPGPRLVYSFYHATHYPYRHDATARYQKHTPEVDYEFNYNRSGLFEWKDQIVNRYKNTLLQMDDWYRDILQKVDLSKTIVIITGDHGEEFFQQGRLGHCSSLNIHQTMTPCLVYIPGVESADVTFITSHADIMPTIADALGHEKKPETLGQSLTQPVAFRYAVVSHYDSSRCYLWAVATEYRMAVFERDYWDKVEIKGLTDWHGRHRVYRGDAEIWSERFRVIRRVEEQFRTLRD
jgi:uncharacterized protein